MAPVVGDTVNRAGDGRYYWNYVFRSYVIGDIEPGYYKTRAYKNGPWVPIRVWLQDGERDTETNELLSDQLYLAEENRSEDNQFAWTLINPFDEKNVYWREITKEQFRWIIIQKTL